MAIQWDWVIEKLNFAKIKSLAISIISSIILGNIGLCIAFAFLFSLFSFGFFGIIICGGIIAAIVRIIKSLFGLFSRTKRCLTYVDFFASGTKSVSIKSLAAMLNVSIYIVKDDLRWMTQQGYMQGITPDYRKDTFYLYNDNGYYTPENPPCEIANDAKGSIPAGSRKKSVNQQKENDIVFKYIEGDIQYEATRFTGHLAMQKERCKDIEISEKIANLRTGVGKLLSYGYQNPSDCEKIRAFNRKYLNPSINLIDKYIEMDQLVKGSTIHIQTRSKLLGGLDNLIHAYSLNLENMYNDDIVDIASDITVIESMLAQEGLLESELTLDMDDFFKNK